MFNIKETADTLKTKAAKLNEEVLKATDGMVDETLAAGQEWNKVLGRALKTGTYIFSQQQDLALTALEGAKKQYVQGNKRFRSLMGFKTAEKAIQDVKAEVIETVEDTKKVAKKAVKSTKKVLATTAKKATPAKKVLATTAKEANIEVAAKSKAVKRVLATTAKPAAAKKVLATTKKAATPAKTVKTVTPKKAVAPKVVAANDLKVINGIGPKMEKVLNAAGIKTFADLAAFNADGLKNILTTENPRYAMYEPKEWIIEAKKLMK